MPAHGTGSGWPGAKLHPCGHPFRLSNIHLQHTATHRGREALPPSHSGLGQAGGAACLPILGVLPATPGVLSPTRSADAAGCSRHCLSGGVSSHLHSSRLAGGTP